MNRPAVSLWLGLALAVLGIAALGAHLLLLDPLSKALALPAAAGAGILALALVMHAGLLGAIGRWLRRR